MTIKEEKNKLNTTELVAFLTRALQNKAVTERPLTVLWLHLVAKRSPVFFQTVVLHWTSTVNECPHKDRNTEVYVYVCMGERNNTGNNDCDRLVPLFK